MLLTIKLHFIGLVQYQANITFSQEYIRSFIDQEFRRKRQVEETYKATEERLNKLIDSVRKEEKERNFNKISKVERNQCLYFR